MKKRLTVDDLPADVVAQMKKAINDDKKVKDLKEQWCELVKFGQYAQALQIRRILDGLEGKVINEYLSRYKGEAERMDRLMQDMPDSDREEMNVNVNVIIFLCDQMESLVMECNSILKRHHPEYRLEMFDRLTEVGKEAKEHVRFMSEVTEMMYQTNFGDYADDMTEMVMNKARAFIRKMKRLRESGECPSKPEQ